MALTKKDITERIWDEAGFSKAEALDLTETILEIIKGTLAAGEDVLVSGFGKFSVKTKAERKGRNPATAKDLMLRARQVVTFKCSGKLRDRINQSEGKTRAADPNTRM